MKTYSQKSSEISRDWYIIDASTMPLGKLAVIIADKLMGKSKVTYTPHIDNGDYVVVINAKKIQVTGNKMTKKMYRHHTGYAGGLKEISYRKLMAKKSDFALKEAVRGMLPKNSIGAKSLTRCKIYKGADHDHQAQKPETL